MPLIIIAMFMQTSEAQSINTFKWKNRILILMDSEGNSDILNQQLKAFDNLEDEIKERDLILFCFDGSYLLDSSQRKTSYQLSSNIDSDFQGVLLIGKDGGIKLKRPFITDPKIIFDTIDSMPMRKAEMKRSGNN